MATMTSAGEEYAASRAAAALFDFDFRASLVFTGPDAPTFLHNILSNDILSLRPGGGCYTTLLTQQSKVVADANVFCFADRLRLDVDRELKSRAREHLEKFLVADDVEIDDPSERESMLGVLGPRMAEVLRAAGAEAPAGDREHLEAVIAGVECWIARVDWSGDPGVQIVTASPEAARVRSAIASAGESMGLVSAGREALEVLRMEAGIPWPGIDFDETHLVLEAGLERGISFKKGCYLGQEVVERASARGHVNRRLVGLRLETERAPSRGTRISNQGADVGQVTSAALSPALAAAIALGYVRREVMEPGTRLEIDGAPAVVTALPFYRGR
jgi:folate-binding protein YgfZ